MAARPEIDFVALYGGGERGGGVVGHGAELGEQLGCVGYGVVEALTAVCCVKSSVVTVWFVLIYF